MAKLVISKNKNQYKDWYNKGDKRGSLVWFHQPSMIQSAEVRYKSLAATKKAKASTRTNFNKDSQLVFKPTYALQLQQEFVEVPVALCL